VRLAAGFAPGQGAKAAGGTGIARRVGDFCFDKKTFAGTEFLEYACVNTSVSSKAIKSEHSGQAGNPVKRFSFSQRAMTANPNGARRLFVPQKSFMTPLVEPYTARPHTLLRVVSSYP
jgi:hypothetical protein